MTDLFLSPSHNLEMNERKSGKKWKKETETNLKQIWKINSMCKQTVLDERHWKALFFNEFKEILDKMKLFRQMHTKLQKIWNVLNLDTNCTFNPKQMSGNSICCKLKCKKTRSFPQLSSVFLDKFRNSIAKWLFAWKVFEFIRFFLWKSFFTFKT